VRVGCGLHGGSVCCCRLEVCEFALVASGAEWCGFVGFVFCLWMFNLGDCFVVFVVCVRLCKGAGCAAVGRVSGGGWYFLRGGCAHFFGVRFRLCVVAAVFWRMFLVSDLLWLHLAELVWVYACWVIVRFAAGKCQG